MRNRGFDIFLFSYENTLPSLPGKGELNSFTLVKKCEITTKIGNLFRVYKATAALNFTQIFRQELGIGIDIGPVLVFDLVVGGKDIALAYFSTLPSSQHQAVSTS
jgi:hypothetical protein